MQPSKWITVATVVKDDVEGFKRTLESLAAQDLAGVEFLVVDSSADQTEILEALSSYSAIENSYTWLPPSGIYPAMNRALADAVGKTIYFLNAGDAFASADVLKSLEPIILEPKFTWGFGPVEIIELSGNRVITPSWNYSKEKARAFSAGHFPPHQGTIVSTKSLRDVGGFDTSYRIAADYAAFLALTLVADPVHFPMVIAAFQEGGTSTIHWRKSFTEFHRARIEILNLQGAVKYREMFETKWHFARVYLNREIRTRVFRYRSSKHSE